MLRSIDNWEGTPGNLDTLNVFKRSYQSDNIYGIPELLDTPFVPKGLVPYGTQVRRKYAQVEGKCVHFFLDDHKFEPLWSKPNKTLPPIQYVGQAISPDFSISTDYPLAVNVWQIYRSRWLARYWQEHNIDVIPNVTWTDEESYEYCFLGIPKGSMVAVGTVGINSKAKKEAFKRGFEEMMRQIEPLALVVYGETMPVEFDKYCDIVYTYPSYWKERRRQIQKEDKHGTTNTTKNKTEEKSKS